MNKITVFRISLLLTTFINLLGAYYKIVHNPYGSFLLALSAVLSLGFILPGLKDIFGNPSLKFHEKWMWTIGFVFLSWVAGYLYLPKFKKLNSGII
jgi:hypothetical protein